MLERAQDELAGRFDAADHLDDDVDVASGDEAGGVRGEQLVRHVEAALPLEPAHGDAGELERRTDPLGELGRVAGEQARDLGAHDTAAQESDPQGSLEAGCTAGRRNAHRARVSARDAVTAEDPTTDTGGVDHPLSDTYP